MGTDEQIRKRLGELEQQATAMRSFPTSYGHDGVEEEAARRWASSAMHILARVFGEGSPHYRNLATAYKEFHGYAPEFYAMRGIFVAAKSDYEGGYLFSLQAAVAGEIFGDFVNAARHALDAKHKDVAAVLACAALEDSLKRFARLHSLNVDDNDMSEVINALKGAGLLSGPQKTLIDAMPKIRNAAMHAEWGKLTPENVGSVLGFVEQFLLTKFS